jgi:hypothetical protein
MTEETPHSRTETVPHAGCVIRAGDIVHHEPTGEDWVVAYVDGECLGWCGWPAGEAKLSDCWLKKTCTNEEHLHWLQEIAKSDGKPATRAKRALEQLTNSRRPEGAQ